MPRILLIEDDPQVREGLEIALRHLGHDVASRGDGEAGVEAVRSAPPDVVVLDVMLPGADGFETCRRLRAFSQVPIVMLTARSDDLDVVAGLEAGADDYLTKPVRPRVLEAKLKAVLRRAAPATPAGRSGPLEFGDVVVDRGSLVVTKGGTALDLTPMELRLLLALAGSPGLVLSRQQLLAGVWGQDHLGDSRLVDACVQRLRAKIEDVPADPQLLRTVRGFGYRFGL
ncbi:MAG: DNA-binding response regulator [Frankiales bacterium]|nr:DNA-binding response regulator [Frankiales bacterium]